MKQSRLDSVRPCQTGRLPLSWALLPALIYAFAALIFVFWGGFIGDEGYYALMARNVSEGLMPYRDFFCPQMPLLYYAVGGWFSLFGPGVVAGRLMSGIFGLCAVILVCAACHRRAGALAAMVAGLLLACNPHIVFDTIEIKTQGLSFMLSAALIFVLSTKNDFFSIHRAVVALLFGSLMFLTRLSLLPALLLLWMYVGWRLRKRPVACLLLLGANIAVLSFLYFFFSADGNFVFGVYRVHSEYWSGGGWSLARFSVTLKSWFGNQMPIILFFFSAIAVFAVSSWRKLRQGLCPPDLPFLLFLLLSYWGYTLLHWSSVQSYATHQTVVAGFAVVFSAVTLAPVFHSLAARSRVFASAAFVLLLCLPMPFGEWAVSFKGDGSIGRIREAVGLIGKYAGKNDSILTFNVELPVEAGLRVPVECAMGEFSYVPNMPDQVAEKYRMLNLRKLAVEIESGRHRILCMGNREFAIMAGGNPDVAAQLKTLIDQKYLQVGSVKNYGQFNQELYIFAAKY